MTSATGPRQYLQSLMDAPLRATRTLRRVHGRAIVRLAPAAAGGVELTPLEAWLADRAGDQPMGRAAVIAP